MTITDEMDIARLIERLNLCLVPPGWEWKDVEPLIREAAAALSRLTAQPLPDEIAGLMERAESSIRAYEATHNEDSQACRLLRYLAAALRAMALENERLKAEHNNINAAVTNIVAERDAIRLKTIEECDRIARGYGLHNLAAAVALAQSVGEGKEEDLPTAQDVRGILRPET